MSRERVVVREARPDAPAVAPIIAIHVAAMDNGDTPADVCHRLDLAGLLDPSITFFAAYDETSYHQISNHTSNELLHEHSSESPDQTLDVSAATSPRSVAPLGIGAFAYRTADWGEVKSMHVLEAHRGRGISRIILQAIEGAARARGVHTLRLETARHFTAAISLYQRSGFQQCSAFGDDTDHPASLFMEKRLS